MAKKRKKNPQKVRAKRSWIIDVPIFVCIVFLIMGLLIGNVFVFIIWHEGKLVDKEETISVTASFDSYTILTSPKGSLNEVRIEFRDREALYVDGACFDGAVGRALNSLQSGETVELLLHPISNYVWEMTGGEGVILSFDDAKMRTRSENVSMSVLLGSFGYFCIGFSGVSLLLKARERRKSKKTKKR